MEAKVTSMREVVGMVIRNTGVQDSGYISSMHEWIFDAMNQLETSFSLAGKCEDLTVKFHKAKLPCELEYIDAVSYNGQRLKENRTALPASKHTLSSVSSNIGLQTFDSALIQIEPITDHKLYYSTLSQVQSTSEHTNHYYYTELGYINTSFAEGKVRIFYQAIPVDADDMPLIPDNQNYKNALYWYCRAMMIGAGWKDRIFTWEACMKNFEDLYAPRALAEIRMPSPDQMEKRVDLLTRFLPAAGYYESFFHVDRGESFYEPSSF